MLCKLQKYEEEHFLTKYIRPILSCYQNQIKTLQEKKTRPIFLMNVYVNTPYKVAESQIKQQCIKGTGTMNNWNLSQECKIGLTYKS